jgi:hypothetical protein
MGASLEPARESAEQIGALSGAAGAALREMGASPEEMGAALERSGKPS